MQVLSFKNFKKVTILLSVFLCLGFGSCKTLPSQKLDKARDNANATRVLIDNNQDKIENSGKAFLWAGKYSNEKETNRTIAIDVSHRFLDLASISIGNPSVKDAANMKDIVDGLMFEARLDNQSLSNKLLLSQSDINFYKKQVKNAESKLDEFTKKVESLQNEKSKLEQDHQKNIEDIKKVSDENAIKAQKFDEENTFWNSINPFHDLAKLVKKLAILGTIGGSLIGIFRLLELFFPQLNIVGGIFGMLGKVVFKFAPGAKKAAGVVATSVWDAFKVNVKAIDSFFEELAKGKMEASILQTIPNDAKLSKLEITNVLDTYSQKIEEEIKNQLNKFHDESSKAVVNLAKDDLGIQTVAPKNLL